MSEYQYVHPRSTSTLHVAAIEDRIRKVIAVSKRPDLFVMYLLRRRTADNVTVLAANCDALCTTILLICAFKSDRYILHLSSHRTSALHWRLLNYFANKKNAQFAFVTEHVRSVFFAFVKGLDNTNTDVVWHSSRVADIGLEAQLEPCQQRRDIDCLFFGRLENIRGLDEFLNLAERNPMLKFAVAGRGTLADTVRKLSEAHSNLKFFGDLQDPAEKARLLRRTKMLISCMKATENFGIAVLEAVSCGALASVPYSYGAIEILGTNSPCFRQSGVSSVGITLDEHVRQMLVGAEPCCSARSLHKFHSKEIRRRWIRLSDRLN